jgi:1-acyl-sn-glycerol-3-phosphate acyltransferase
VVVCNHASYLDGVLLVAALPRRYTFVAKRELQQHRIVRAYLCRLGTMFVERSEAARAVADAQALTDALERGCALVVFPEGTFEARPSLLPFHLGAFLAAARSGVPVVPVAVRGTRQALPDGRWWPQHVALHVDICEPVTPEAGAPDPFAQAARLREAAQRSIAERFGPEGDEEATG